MKKKIKSVARYFGGGFTVSRVRKISPVGDLPRVSAVVMGEIADVMKPGGLCHMQSRTIFWEIIMVKTRGGWTLDPPEGEDYHPLDVIEFMIRSAINQIMDSREK